IDTGITLVNTDSRATGVLQSLVLNHLIVYGGGARWIDSKGHARTDTMHRLAPNQHLLDKIQVARAFTPQQHFALVEDLAIAVDRETTLMVLPDVNTFYAADDLMTGEREEMLHAALQNVHDTVERYRIPALITTSDCGEALSYVAEAYADAVIDCRMTEHGPYFSSDRFETLVYPGNGYVQTTLTLFQHLLQEAYTELRVEDRDVEVTADR
ncbi:MAG: hypothetical protein ABEI97_02120, partial [Candidatus Nanohaloarchaea archaeon]